MASDGIDDLLRPLDADVPYEEAVLQNPYSVKGWLNYILFKADAPAIQRNIVYERALREIPGSYKIWYRYLKDRKQQVRGKRPGDQAFESVNNAFERCLVFLNKMPRIWFEYLEFLIQQRKVVKTKEVFDRATRSLPFGQHARLWKLYIKFVRQPGIPTKLGIKVFRRYLKYEPTRIEEFIDYLVTVGEWDEAAKQIIVAVNKEDFVSIEKGKSKRDLWIQLCDIISKHSEDIKSVKVDHIIRGGLTKFSDEIGKLWTTLADYYIRLGHFEKARDVLEEGMNSVITVKDFTQIWDAYAKFEDSLLAAQMENMAEEEGDDEQDTTDFEWRTARYEYLIDRQPFLVNSVLLRQNPHNVIEWQKRADLYEKTGDVKSAVAIYEKALQTVDPQKAKGKPHSLWVNFAKLYERVADDINSARAIFEKATKAEFKYIDDLATVWCEFAEMELRHNNYDEARTILQRACTQQKTDKKDSIQRKLYRSTKLWSFYADIEESLGTLMTTKAVYDKMIDLKVVTPQIVINYAHWLEENKFFEESFKAYEKGIAQFPFPHVFDVWVAYLMKFVSRYGGRKLERARELFEQVIESCPAKDAKVFYVMYANLEEEFGLARHAMSIYDRATRAVAEGDRFAIFALYIGRATEFFGATKTREIYEKAIDVLPDKQVKEMCLRYAELEKRLGEIDRARAVYVHASQMCDPRFDPDFWNKFRQFEVDHGNEDTYREMLRIKRSVQAQLSSQINFTSAEMLNASKQEFQKFETETEMEALERKQATDRMIESARMAALPSTVSSTSTAKPIQFTKGEQAFAPAPPPVAAKVVNPEQIELADEEESEEEGKEDMVLEEKKVPTAVFTRNVPTEATKSEKKKGALERLKKKKE